MKIKSYYGPGGALVTSEPVPILSNHRLNQEMANYYGGQYLIAETLSINDARVISKALGLEFMEPPMAITGHD